ncbi:hypothetical protein PJI17_31765, partial [Mycobacterium kansasii]
MNFFWGWSKGKRKCHWKNWHSLATPKTEGGIGFRELANIMKAFRIKMSWSIKFGQEDNVWKSYMVSKYHQDLSTGAI